MDYDSETELKTLFYRILSSDTTDSEKLSLKIAVISLLASMDLESQPKPESKLMSLVIQAICVFHSMDLASQPEPLLKLISLISQRLSHSNSMDLDYEPIPDSELKSLIDEALKLEPRPELISLIRKIIKTSGRRYYEEARSEADRLAFIEEKKKFHNTLVSGLEPEPQLRSLISHLISLNYFKESYCEDNWKTDMLIIELISLVSSMDMDSQPKPESEVMSLVTQAISVFHSMDLDSQPEPLLKLICQKLSLVNNVDTDNEQIPELGLMSLAREAMNLEPRPELISLLHQILDSFTDEESDKEKNPRKSMNSDWEPERKLISLISQLIFIYSLLDEEYYLDAELESRWEFVSIIMKIISQVTSLNLNSQPKPASKLMFLITQAISVFNFLDLNRQPERLREFILYFIKQHNTGATGLEDKDAHWIPFYLKSNVDSAMSLTLKPELISLIHQIISLFITKYSEPKLFALIHQKESLNNTKVSDSEPKLELESESLDSVELSHQRDSADLELFSLIHERKSFDNSENSDLEPEMKLLTLISQLIWPHSVSQFVSLFIQSIFLMGSMDFDSQPKPESELISLTTEAIIVFNSMDLNAEPKPLPQLKSLVSQELSLLNSIDPETKSGSGTMSDSKTELDLEFWSLLCEVKSLKPEVELISIIHQIYSLVISMNSASGKHNFLCAQLVVRLEQGKFHVTDEDKWHRNSNWSCLPEYWEEFRFKEGEDTTHFLCRSCFGENHKFNKAPVEIKHHFHPKHSLQLVLLCNKEETRKCYCCHEDLREIFYYCPACDFAMNVACVEKPPLLSAIVHLKWHEHTLALFSRKAPLACNLCAADDLSAPVYMCPPCGFVVHLRCLNLPRVIRISRHPRRISFTPFFDQEDLSCGVCRTKINNEYGGYSCIKDGFSYVAHSRCATQSNVWDGVELEGEPEETEEEELEPFVRISDGIIRHFSHEDHLLRLNDNTDEDYDENRQCQICTMLVLVKIMIEMRLRR